MNMDRYYRDKMGREKLTTFVPTEVKDDLKIIAIKRKTSVQNILRNLICDYTNSEKTAG